MKATVTEPESWQRIVKVEIPVEEVEAKYEEKLKKYKKEIKLPGFRPGKVPAKLLNQRFGPAIREESIDELINGAYGDALKENKITPVAEPKISDIEATDKDKPVKFTAEVQVDPEVEIKDYKKIKIKASAKKLKDADIDQSIEDLRDRMAELKDLDRKSKKGDILTVSYTEATVDGEAKDDFSPAPQMIELGKSVIKEFDKELAGLKAEDEKEVAYKFPKDYRDTDIAGKAGTVKIKVVKVQEKIIPEINEDFLKKLGDFKDEAALRDRIREDMEKAELDKAKGEAYDKAIDAIIEKNDFDVPPARVEYYLDRVAEDEAKYYPEGKEVDREDIDKRYREMGIKALKRYRIVDFIANKEKIKASQADVDEKIKEIAAQYGQPFEEVKKAFRQNGTTVRIREELKEQTVLDTLIGEREWPENKEK